MKITLVNWLSEQSDISKIWRKQLLESLRIKYGVVANEYHLLNVADENKNVIFKRILMLYRLIKLLPELRKSSKRIMVYPYCFTYMSPIIRMICGEYIIKCTDAVSIREMVTLNATACYKKVVFHCHYWSWRLWLYFSSSVITSNHCTKRIAYKLGKSCIVIYDISVGFFEPKTNASKTNPPVFGCICSSGTEHLMDEYVDFFKSISSEYSLEILGCSESFASRCGAKLLKWNDPNVKYAPARWLCGLSLLPSNAELSGKFMSKTILYMEIGIPVLMSPQGEAPYIVPLELNDHSGLHIVRNTDEMKRLLDYFRDNPSCTYRENLQKECRNKHSVDAITTKIMEFLCL